MFKLDFAYFLEMAERRICYFFGSFDPITNAHVDVAKAAQAKYGFSKIIFVPAHEPPHKQNLTDFAHRMAMCQLAVKPYGFVVSDIESKLQGLTYTVKTIGALEPTEEKIPFIIGADAISQIHTWLQPEVLAKKLIFVVANRGTFVPPKSVTVNGQVYPVEIWPLSVTDLGISSTEVRRKISKGEDISNLVPTSVAEYIYRNKLYGL